MCQVIMYCHFCYQLNNSRIYNGLAEIYLVWYILKIFCAKIIVRKSLKLKQIGTRNRY